MLIRGAWSPEQVAAPCVAVSGEWIADRAGRRQVRGLSCPWPGLRAARRGGGARLRLDEVKQGRARSSSLASRGKGAKQSAGGRVAVAGR